MILSEDKIREYIDKKGMLCLFCGSDQLRWGFIESGSGAAYQKVTCLVCGESWTDGYKLVSVAPN